MTTMRRTRRSAIAVVLAVAAAGGAAGAAAAAPSTLPTGTTTPVCSEDGTLGGVGNGRRWGDGSGTAAQDGSGSAQGPGGQAARAGRGGGRGGGAGTAQSRGGTGNGGGGNGQGGAGLGGSGEAVPPAVEGATVSDEIAAQLLYIVEEEKLAGDIYELAYDQWGLRVFGNIAGSEDRHADEVRELLNRYRLADPSSEYPGEFSDDGLQALYDELAGRVLASLDEAVDVGLTIEDKDIADLQVLLTEDLPADVQQVVANLLAGSQRHQAAFTRQA